MNGSRGSFEGVYWAHWESSGFAFCTKDECPDHDQMECRPKFSVEADKALKDFNQDARIHMIVSGRISTGDTYGHMGEHLCELSIDRVRNPRVLNDTLVRSRKYPLLTDDWPEK